MSPGNPPPRRRGNLRVGTRDWGGGEAGGRGGGIMLFAYFRIISHIFSHILAPCLFVNCAVYATAYPRATVFLCRGCVFL